MVIQRRAAGSELPQESPVADWQPVIRGGPSPIVIVCDSPSWEAQKAGLPCSWEELVFFSQQAKPYGFQQGDIAWVSICPPMPMAILKSDSKRWAHVQPCVEAVHQAIRSLNPRIIIPLGNLACRVVLGRATAITKARGVAQLSDSFGVPVLPMYSPGYVQRQPDNLPAFQADLNTLARIKRADYDISMVEKPPTNYKWVFDLDEVRDQIKHVISVDTEGSGLRWHDQTTCVYTIQISPKPGVAWCFPVGADYINKWFTGSGEPGHGPKMTEEQRVKLVAQLKELLEDGSIRKMGQNFKFDNHMLRKPPLAINVQGWLHDTQLMGFCVDENMLRKDLDELIRVFVPDMAGYADEFNRTTDKSRMIDVPPYDIMEGNQIVRRGMLDYAGGDPDAVFRLAKVLDTKMRQDPRQYNCYRRIMIPAILVFANSVERYGMRIDVQALNAMEGQLTEYVNAKYRQLIRMVPPAVRRKHLKDGLSFTRDKFKLDILFSKEGFNLTPKLFTDSTKDLEDPKQRVPQVGKDHLTYFVNHKNPIIATFCSELIALGAAQKMLSTYVGSEEEGSGFHQYIAEDGNIYPSYMLHRTNTGRTASADPNGQNFPKRSPKNGPDWATMYQGIFLARPGYKLVNCDLSQIELRLVAWMAKEPTMLKVYAEGGDIHTTTAMEVLGYSQEKWDALTAKEKKDLRFKAKAVNFGLIYGMSAGGFQVYAKTDYGLDLTMDEAEDIRAKFFRLYSWLPAWHETMKEFCKREGYVRGMHGALRHLPSIFSNDRGIQSQAVRQAINAPIQRMGSDLGLIAMIRFASQMNANDFRIIGFVHDAIVLECREGMEEQGASYLKWVMESTPLEAWFGCKSPIPILAECDIATDQSSATLEERKDIVAVKPEWWNDNEEEAIEQFKRAYVTV